MLATGVPNSTRLLFVAEIPICTCVSPRITILLIADCEEKADKRRAFLWTFSSVSQAKIKREKATVQIATGHYNSETFDNNFMQSLKVLNSSMHFAI